MADIDNVNDRYNPPSNMSVDYQEFQFGELEVDDLFWQTNRPENTNPWRKVSLTEAVNIKTQTTHNFNTKTKVFQKV